MFGCVLSCVVLVCLCCCSLVCVGVAVCVCGLCVFVSFGVM